MRAGWTGACALLVVACSSGGGGARGPEAVPVKVAPVEKRSVPITVQANGSVEAWNLVTVRPQVGGIITQVAFQEGQDVNQGDLLFQIDPRPYQAALDQAQQALARDQAKADAAMADLERYQKLVGKEFVTAEEYDQKKADAASMKATLGTDRAAVETARLNLSYCTVRAPETGRTGAVLVREGNLVKANDELVTIAKIKPVRVSFSIPETEIEALRQRQQALATFVTPKMSSQPIEGKLSFINNTVDPTTGTLLLKAQFPNEDERLWPGEFVDVRLELGSDPNAEVVPAEAVQTGQAGTYVFVVQGDQTVQQRPVKLERQTPRYAVIANGLQLGETVVTDGQLRLTSGAKVAVTGTGGAGGAGGGAPSAQGGEANR